jgi:hypothetical protein
VKLTDKQKHDIADRLALWVSASLDMHAANDLMRQSIREWLDFQTEDANPPHEAKPRRDVWWTVFGACMCALTLWTILSYLGKWTAMYLIARGWI